jgi:hypothetical protein
MYCISGREEIKFTKNSLFSCNRPTNTEFYADSKKYLKKIHTILEDNKFGYLNFVEITTNLVFELYEKMWAKF